MRSIQAGRGLAADNATSARVLWMRATACGALLMTVVDAFLLRRSKSFFTGGFLAPLHTSGIVETSGFMVLSVLADAALVGVTAWMAILLLARVRLTASARALAVVILSVTPLLFMDFVSYRRLSYVGDAFDLDMMFELTGRRIEELVAVASPQIVGALTLAGLTGGGAITLVWAVNRPRERRQTLDRPAQRLLAPVVGLLMLGVATTTVAALTNETFEDGLRRKRSGRTFETVLARLTDFDGDGFGLVGGMRDPALFDGNVYPRAVDLPGNGIDENGVAGDLPADSLPYTEGGAPQQPWKRRPNVVLFVLESFRADAVGRRVNGKAVTPVLHALAREGVSSSRAYSHNGYTAQSRFHLLTGSLAGLRGGTSLIDDFAATGYETAYFSAQDESFGGEELAVGFDRASTAYDARRDRDRRYSTYTTAGSLAVSHKVLSARIDEFLATRDSGRPLFLYVNFHDTHFPYDHHEMDPILPSRRITQSQIAPARQSEVQEMFNAAANVDRALASTVAGLTRVLGAPPAVIVTSDHGESLFDEGFLGHGYALNDIQTGIPLIVRGLPMEIVEPFGQVDLRNAIATALVRDVLDDAPRIVEDPEKLVFQYLGNIGRPRQIAFTGLDGTLVYDFRDRQLLLPDGKRARPEVLSGGAADQFQRLIHFWERMTLARTSMTSNRSFAKHPHETAPTYPSQNTLTRIT